MLQSRVRVDTRRRKVNPGKPRRMVLSSLQDRLRFVNKGVVAAVVVFLVAYAAVLWFKFNDPRGTVTTIVQGAAGEGVAELTDPALIPPQSDLARTPVSTSVASDSGLQAPRPVPAAPVQPVTGTAGNVYEQTETWKAPPEESVAPQLTGPDGDLAISGRVLDRAGAPVPGIALAARASYLFDRDKGKMTPVYRYQRGATSGYDGAYAFERLADGEYHISTKATDQYPQARISVRAGVDFADLVLTGQQDLRVFGMVTTSLGEPLAGVAVTPVIRDSPTASSNKEGRYSFEVKLLDNAQSLAVRASKKDYEDQEVRLDTSKPEAGKDLELNIVMEPDADNALAEVSGRVTGPGNEPVAGQRIGLSSAKVRQNYRPTTDAEGRFVIQRVEPGDDYMLSINAVAAYKDYFQRDIKVTKNGLTLNVELETLDTGTLSGQMLNVFGSPIPNFTLVLQTKETSYYSQRVLGDSGGNFTVEKAPAGELSMKTKSNPYYTIEGIQLNAGAEQEVPVILDWGYDAIQGQVANEQGYPVAVTNISLTWSYQQGGIRSKSRRTTSADEQGNFRFTQLGPGRHRLTVNATGYKPAYVDHDVALQGSAIEVKLQEK